MNEKYIEKLSKDILNCWHEQDINDAKKIVKQIISDTKKACGENVTRHREELSCQYPLNDYAIIGVAIQKAEVK